MAGSATKSWWDYSTWMKNIGRNSRITELQTPELVWARVIVAAFYNPQDGTGTRPWLDNKFRRLAVNGNYSCDPASEPEHVICKMIEVIGRDLKKIPMTDVESSYVTILMAATNNRSLGTSPYYGGVIGADVAVP